MTQLSLGICSRYSVVLLQWPPFFVLLVCTHSFKSKRKHGKVEDTGILTEYGIGPNKVTASVINEPLLFVQLPSSIRLFHLKFPLFFRCHLVVLMRISQNRVALHELDRICISIVICFIQNWAKYFSLNNFKVLVVPLFLQSTVNNFIFPAALNIRFL